MKRRTPFILILLLIEFLDEFVYGAREAAWPLIRDDLGLNYTQVGLLLGLPGLIGAFIEPVVGILGDTWKRRALILGGGLFFAAATLLTAVSTNFWFLLLSFVLFSPSSGAFVSLSQAALMDEQPDRHENNMARWTFAGSIGVVAGPLALGGAVFLGVGWRGLYAIFGVLTLLVLGLAASYLKERRINFEGGRSGSESQRGFVHSQHTDGENDNEISEKALPPEIDEKKYAPIPEIIQNSRQTASFRSGLKAALNSLRRREVIRWLVLLEFSDFMLDVLLGFLALYLVDIARATPAQAGIAVAVWTGVGLFGDFLLIPLLERVRGLAYLRISVILELILYPIFLLVPSFWIKVVLLAFLGLFNAGWYSILKGRLYSAMPGQSGTVMTVGNISGLAGSLMLVGLGMIGQRWGLSATMWALLLGPIVLLLFTPYKTSEQKHYKNGKI